MIELVHENRDFVIFYFKDRYYKCSPELFFRILIKSLIITGFK